MLDVPDAVRYFAEMAGTRPPRMLIGFDGKYGGSSSTYVSLGVVAEDAVITGLDVLSLTRPALPSTIKHPLHATIERVGRYAGMLGARFTPDARGATLTFRVRTSTPLSMAGQGTLSQINAQAALDGLAEVASSPAMALGAGQLEVGWADTHDVDSSSYGFRDLAGKLVPLLTLQSDASEDNVWRAWRDQDEAIRLGRVLDYLDLLKSKRPENYDFDGGARPQQIAALEEQIGVELPEILRMLLRRVNGGRFVQEGAPPNPSHEAEGEATTGRVECELLSTEEMASAHTDLIATHEAYVTLDGWVDRRPLRPRYRTSQGDVVPWPYVPVARTVDGQELLVLEVFQDPRYKNRVQEAFHEVGPVEWGILHERYIDFLESFVANGGVIKAVA